MGIALLILGIVFLSIGLTVVINAETNKGLTISVILILLSPVCFVIGLTKMDNEPSVYEVKSAQTFYGSTEKINRVWLKDSDGSYFWIEVPDCDKPKFCEGEYIELSRNDFKNWIVSKELD